MRSRTCALRYAATRSCAIGDPPATVSWLPDCSGWRRRRKRIDPDLPWRAAAFAARRNRSSPGAGAPSHGGRAATRGIIPNDPLHEFRRNLDELCFPSRCAGCRPGAWRGRCAVSGSPHLLRRPQLRRACGRDGLYRPRAAVLLHEAGRCGAAGRRGQRRPDALPEPDEEPAPRGRAGRRDRQGRPQHPRCRRDGPHLGLRGRARHDAPRPAGRGEEARPAVGHRQGLRRIGADRPAAPRRGLRDLAPRRRSGSTSTASSGRPA